MIDKKEKTDILLKKIKSIVSESIRKQKYDKALAAIAFIGNYLYQYNQFYTEDELEDYLRNISDCLKKEFRIEPGFRPSQGIIFYDGFGLDTRGVALMYLNALGLNNYHVIYVTNRKEQENIPTIRNMCDKYHFEMQFIDMNNYMEWSKQLCDLFTIYKPRAAFFYTTPNDVSGIVTFHMFESIVDRYLIDLTDHAFWLGKSAVDYFLGSRNMSASLQFYHRGIQKSQMIKLGVNLLVEEAPDHSGLPFDIQKTDYIFSGGALYKTLGDPNNTYYRIVDHILTVDKNIKFLYAGTGDDSELSKIVEKYPGRAYHIKERKDFYYLISNCKLYLNTYPMFGGMMMKYCGLAHKLPITLKHGHDSDGLLLHQDECQIEYSTYEELIEDVDKLLVDDNYRQAREKLLDGSVITEERFKNNVYGVIEKHKTDYEHEYEEIDTNTFRKEYYERFNYDDVMLDMVKSINISLLSEFSQIFIKGLFIKSVRKLKRKLGAK